MYMNAIDKAIERARDRDMKLLCEFKEWCRSVRKLTYVCDDHAPRLTARDLRGVADAIERLV